MFHKDLEKSLIGMKKEGKKELLIDGNKVSVHIDKISRNVIPEITDYNVIKWKLKNIENVKGFREWVTDYLKEEERKERAFKGSRSSIYNGRV